MKEELKLVREKSLRRRKDKKKLIKEVEKLRKELEDVYKQNERAIKVAQILDFVDKID